MTIYPHLDPLEITVVKKDAETGESDNNGAYLSGIQFTINYYAVLDGYDSAADLEGLTPTRTWVIETKKVETYDEVTETTDITYQADLSTIINDLSDDLYTVEIDGVTRVGIPSGCITVEETSANDEYTMIGELQQLQESTSFGEITDNVFFWKHEANEYPILYTEVLSRTNQRKRLDIKFTKVDIRDGSVMPGKN